MSASKEWTDYHLTLKGWTTGSQRLDFAGIEEKPIPADRVLTVRAHEVMSSPFSPMRSWEEETWKTDDAAKVQELLTEFGKCPGGIAGLPGARE